MQLGYTAGVRILTSLLVGGVCFVSVDVAGAQTCGYRGETRAVEVPGEAGEAKYLLLKPEGTVVKAPAPLLIYLYGAGGSIDGYNLSREPYAGLRQQLCERGYWILVPELGPSHWMNERARRMLDAMVDCELAKGNVDAHRVHIMGTSMGGGSALAYAVHRPRLIRSVCSVMGMTDFRQWRLERASYGGALDQAFGGGPEVVPEAYRAVSAIDHVEAFQNIPVYLISAEKDTVVRPEHGRRLASALAAIGAPVTYREVQGAGHEDAAFTGLEGEVTAFLDRADRKLRAESRPGATLPQDESAGLTILEAKDGTRYGIWGRRPSSPAPTLFIFAGTIEGTLADHYYRQCGTLLGARKWLCVSVDLPCHGREQRAGEPEGLAGWRWRIEHGEPLIEELTARLARVLEDLVARGYTDERRVAACGVSRGGFVAMHFAAGDPRVRCVAAFCPVTDLTRLREFTGVEPLPAVRSLSLSNQAARLADRPVWLVIGDRDARVGTDAAIDLARRVSSESSRRNVIGPLELHVVPEPRGHTVPPGAFQQAAVWIARQIEQQEAKPHAN